MTRNRLTALLSAIIPFVTVPAALSADIADIWENPLQVTFERTQDFNELYEEFGSFHLAEDYLTCPLSDQSIALEDCAEPAVRAASAGMVKYIGNPTRFGNVIVVEHELADNDPAGPFVTTIYGHLRKQGLVAPGTEVSKGQTLGYLSNVNDLTENGGYKFVHLHFGVRKGRAPATLKDINPLSNTVKYAGYSSIFTVEGNRIINKNSAKHYAIKSDWFDPSDFIAKRRNSAHQEALGLYVSSFSSGILYQVEIDTGISDITAGGLGQKLEDLVIDSLGIIYIGGKFTGVRRVDSVTGARLSDIAGNVVGPEGPSIDFYGDRDITQGDLFLNTRFGPGVHTGIWRVQIDSGAVIGEQFDAPFSGWGEGTVFLNKGIFAGNLLAVDSTNGRVIRIPPHTGGVLFGPPAIFIGSDFPLFSPIGIAVNRDGDVFVTEFGGSIVKCNSNGQMCQLFKTGLGLPFFIEFDGADNLYVVENVTGSVLKYAPDGTLIVEGNWPSFLEPVGDPNNEGPVGIGINY